jgi:hypothetical protein
MAQSSREMSFSAKRLADKEHTIELSVKNNTKETLYFVITAGGWKDGKFKLFLFDLKSLGSNDYISPTSIAPGKTMVSRVSKDRLLDDYNTRTEHFDKVLFNLSYSRQHAASAPQKLIALDPM